MPKELPRPVKYIDFLRRGVKENAADVRGAVRRMIELVDIFNSSMKESRKPPKK